MSLPSCNGPTVPVNPFFSKSMSCCVHGNNKFTATIRHATVRLHADQGHPHKFTLAKRILAGDRRIGAMCNPLTLVLYGNVCPVTVFAVLSSVPRRWLMFIFELSRHSRLTLLDDRWNRCFSCDESCRCCPCEVCVTPTCERGSSVLVLQDDRLLILIVFM